MSTQPERKTRYRDIRDEIRRNIESRLYGPGSRLPSDAELGKRFETSRLTVIRALRELEMEGLVQRRAGSGTYVRENAAPTTRVFGLLVPDLSDGEVFEPISHAIARAGECEHQVVLWGDGSAIGRNKEEYARGLCRYFIARRVSGVFFAPVERSPRQHEINRQIAADLEAAGITVVLIDRDLAAWPERSRYDLVGIDNRRAGYRLAAHLASAGCSRLAFAYRPGSAQTVAARRAGFGEALHDLRIEPAAMLEWDTEDEAAVSRWLEASRPDGIVCANDYTAARLMHALLSLSVRIPEEVRVVGINDVKYARFLPVPLTTLRQPCQQIGSMAVRAMLERLNNSELPARDILLDCEMVVRQSCGRDNTLN